MSHSYEEIRSVVLDILAGRETIDFKPNAYDALKLSVEQIFVRREKRPKDPLPPPLDSRDGDLFLEVFWELFRQGIITLGSNDANRQFPHFRLSEFGSRIINNQQAYFFHDVASYRRVVEEEIPNIDSVTLIYLQEAMQAFKSGCILSATVMIGVATEHTFSLMLEAVENNARHQNTYKSAIKERTILKRVNRFKTILDRNINSFTPEIKEDLETHFLGILSIIRTYRNQSGHPTGQIIGREQAYVLLQLFIPYCKKLYQLRAYFQKP